MKIVKVEVFPVSLIKVGLDPINLLASRGMIPLSEKPGIGVEVDVSKLKKYSGM
jgi:L-alanine-DL-glutamate epimerase-like enolase superfamily enzyme